MLMLLRLRLLLMMNMNLRLPCLDWRFERHDNIIIMISTSNLNIK
jgi:hypothetical protein